MSIFKSKILVTIVKYTRIVPVSTKVVISGAAIIAGSNPHFFATSGSIHPIVFARRTVHINVIPTAKASNGF